MDEQITFKFEDKPVIKGFPELRWRGKRPYTSTHYYPAQLKETYGTAASDDWINKIYWGDNLQVMSHLMKKFRGKVDLIYIDPPFDSKAEYKKKIEIKGIGKAESDVSSFEEKQYGDIWTNDEYLQFMYERLILMRELLKDTGSIYLHCDWHKSHYLRIIMDEVFGLDNFQNEIVWGYNVGGKGNSRWGRKHDTILFYSKKDTSLFFNGVAAGVPRDTGSKSLGGRIGTDENGRLYQDKLVKATGKYYRYYLDLPKIPEDWWADINLIQSGSSERTLYPTQKPEALIERIIKASSNPGDLVLDCFMGSGTTQAVAMKLGRRFIGVDINLGAIQTTTKRLVKLAETLQQDLEEKYTGFEVYNVNNYDFFRNPVEARNILIQALGIQEFQLGSVWDGELDGRMVKIMPVNRIATKSDLRELIDNLPIKKYERLHDENPNNVVEKITIVCMGHEPDLKAAFQQELSKYKFDIEIRDILRDRADIQLKRDSEAEIVREGNKLIIRSFYPMNLMQKLSLQKEYVEDWRQLVESVMIDWNYDGAVMQPTEIDIPGKNELVSGIYSIPESAGTIRVKITDLLSESLEKEIN